MDQPTDGRVPDLVDAVRVRGVEHRPRQPVELQRAHVDAVAQVTAQPRDDLSTGQEQVDRGQRVAAFAARDFGAQMGQRAVVRRGKMQGAGHGMASWVNCKVGERQAVWERELDKCTPPAGVEPTTKGLGNRREFRGFAPYCLHWERCFGL
jgi:hypothetical protein